MWYQSRNVKTPHDKADPHVYTSLARRHVLLLGLSGGHNIFHVSNMETHAVFLSSWGLSSWRLSSCTAEQAPNVFAAVCLRQCHRDDFSRIIYFANAVLKFRHSNSSSLNHSRHCNSILNTFRKFSLPPSKNEHRQSSTFASKYLRMHPENMNPPSQTDVSSKGTESSFDSGVLIDSQRSNMQPEKTLEAVHRLDGGRHAWMTVVGAWCCLFASYGFISSVGVFQNFYQSNMLANHSPSNIAWILSLQVFIVSIIAPIAGWVFDNYGPQILVSTGSFLVVFGLMMLSLSTTYYQIFLSQSLCTGLGMGMIFHGSVNSVSTWFQKRRGLAIGLAASGSGIGGVIIP
jgi:hypothetical protein